MLSSLRRLRRRSSSNGPSKPGGGAVAGSSPAAGNAGTAGAGAGTVVNRSADWADMDAPLHPPPPHAYNFRVGIYGWRKRCLYLLILGLLVMVIVNLALTLWVLKVMEFSSEGMGSLRIVSGGVQLRGQALVMDTLLASSIRSRRGYPLLFESSRNFTVKTRDHNGRVASSLFLNGERLDVASQSFRVTDPKGQLLFHADRHEVVVGADSLRVSGEGGAVFDGSVQTPLVRANPGEELMLESPTRSIEIQAPYGVSIESRAGDISAACLTNLKLQSLAGAVRLDSPNVYMPGLKTAHVHGHGTRAPPPPQPVYQLCVCATGKLFMAPATGACAIEETSTVCR
ncbi:delta-sarcoglycan [Schistocerca americana]|uniref:delta-sarcoglycan n=1 Tax=Schistocerca americana TaxID=7009 RepID=UPI001F4F739D|nr:delta-sarcoglycan [Schistocerca americana]